MVYGALGRLRTLNGDMLAPAVFSLTIGARSSRYFASKVKYTSMLNISQSLMYLFALSSATILSTDFFP